MNKCIKSLLCSFIAMYVSFCPLIKNEDLNLLVHLKATHRISISHKAQFRNKSFRSKTRIKRKMQRVTYRRRLSYNTKSNKTRVIKTPGGKLALLYIQKKASAPKCGDCGIALPGVSLFYLYID
jgi:hypothetical protein